MKWMSIVLLLVLVFMSLQAGKVVWNEDGTPEITGAVGKGCVESDVVKTEERNTSKADCGS